MPSVPRQDTPVEAEGWGRARWCGQTGSGAALDSPFPASLLMFAAVPAFMECGELAKKTVGSKAGDKLLVVLPLAAEFVGRRGA